MATAITEALAANPNAAAAQQQYLQAQARLDQTAAQQRQFQTSLTTSVGGSQVDVYQPPPAHQTFGVFQNTLTIPIPVGKKPRFLIEQSRRQLDAAKAQWDSARLALTAQVATAYYDLLRKQALLQIAQETQAQAERQVEEIRKRFRAGDVPELDVLRAQAPVATAQAGVYQADNDVVVARQALNSLLGRSLDAPLVIVDIAAVTSSASPVPELPYTLEQARERALANHPDVRIADATVRASEAALAAARRYREPGVSVQVSDIRSGDQTGFSREDSVQASITIPLNDGGLGRAQIREAEAALSQSRLQADAARRTVDTSIAAAYRNAQSAQRQVQAAATARDIAQLAYDKTAKGYTAGLFPLTDVLNAQVTLRQARIAYTQTIYDAAAAVTSLDNAIGETPATGGSMP